MLDLSSLLRTKSKRDIVIIVFQSKHVECLRRADNVGVRMQFNNLECLFLQ